MSARSQPAGIAFRKHDHRRCQREALAEIDRLFEARHLRLTPRRREVLEILLASHQPMGAYEILEVINRKSGKASVAPPIVYRALAFLLEAGVIHRIESKNAFISCLRPGHQRGAQFLICRDCDRVAELDSSDSNLLAQADRLGFAVDHSVIEITGVCGECQKNGG